MCSSAWTAGELVVNGERAIHPGLTEDLLCASKLYTLYFHSARSMGNGWGISHPIRIRVQDQRPSRFLLCDVIIIVSPGNHVRRGFFCDYGHAD